MGFFWYPAGPIEVGIDGFIEVCDPNTGAALNSIIQVQSKATSGAFTAETSTSFEFVCDQDDLDYWLNGNAPVILICSRPQRNEAYWVPIKEYFKSPEVCTSRKIRFDKNLNKLDEKCKSSLLTLAIPRDAGIYFSPLPRNERLCSNLLTVSGFAKRLFIAETSYRRPGDLWGELNKLGGNFGAEWILKEGRIFSFYDLTKYPWHKVCDLGTVEEFDTDEWAFSKDEDKRRDFIQLLNMSLREKVKADLSYSKYKDCFYFKPAHDLSDRKIYIRKRPRVVFRGYPNKRDPTKIAYYRHSAFKGQFRLYDGMWYLEITPTYYFTWDSIHIDRYFEDRLSGIKRFEKNLHVLGQVAMWVWLLTKPSDMFSVNYPFLQFGRMKEFNIQKGIDDTAWLGHEEEQEAESVKSSWRELPLFIQ